MLARKTRANQILFAYDTLNRLATKTQTAPALVVSYSYGLTGRLIGTSDASAAITAATPPASNTKYATSYGYDALNRPTATAWDPAPLAATLAASSAIFSHAYNKANQRIGQSVSDNTWLEYPVATATTVSYTANALNQYTAVGALTPSYDGNGNLIGDGIFTYGYDAENRFVSASGPGITASYAYDAQGRRKSKTVNGTTTLFVTDADNREILEYDGASGTPLRWYAYGLGPNDVLNQMNVASATRATFIPDIQGSIIATVDSSSGALSKRGYLPYGRSVSTAGTFAYTGQRIDPETNGLHYYRARIYAPAWGRFMQTDPIGYKSGINLYAYVGNDPLNFADPSGLEQNGSSGSGFLSYLAPLPAVAGKIGTGVTATSAAAFGVLAAGFLLATTTTTAGPEQDELRTYVVRAGIAEPNSLIRGTGEHRDIPGLIGFSAQSAPGVPVEELARGGYFPNLQISVTTTTALQQQGYNVIFGTPGRGDYHATVQAPSTALTPLNQLSPEAASQLSPLFSRQLNPFPVPGNR